MKGFNDTAMLDESIRRLAERGAEDKELIRAVRLVWRTYCGIAHGLRWPAVYRAQFGEPVPGGRPGKVEGRVTNSVADLSMGASSVAIFLLNAIERLEETASSRMLITSDAPSDKPGTPETRYPRLLCEAIPRHPNRATVPAAATHCPPPNHGVRP